MKPFTNIRLTIWTIIFFQFVCTLSLAQDNATIVVSGYVTTGNHEKLPGVNVYLKGTTTGTVTNEDGFYSLKLPDGNTTIVYSFIGYQTIEKTISNTHSMTSSHTMSKDRTLNVVLEPNEEMLQEISITTQRKFFGNMDYGRDIPTVKSEEIEKLNTTNASDILHARLSGVWATKTSGAPGDQQKIRIRGQASFFSSAEPLYVIDGVPVPIVNLASLGIGDLNMHDIESVTVLKDASSTAMYGYQGGNGVVLIDTKQHSKHKLDFSYQTGIQWFNNYYDLMDSKDFLESLQLAKANISSMIYKSFPEYSDTLCNHNRQSEIFQMGNLKEYQLSGGGKMDKMSYYLSGNYTKHKGIVKKSEQSKYNLTARIGANISKKLVVNASYRWSYQENINNQNEYMGNQLVFEGITKAPCLECIPEPLLHVSGTGSVDKLAEKTNVAYDLLNSLSTPESILDGNSNVYSFFSHAGSFMARYNISRNLSLNLMESMMIRNSNFSTKSDYSFVRFSENRNRYINFTSGTDFTSDERIALLNHQVNLAYNKTFNGQDFNVSVAHRFYADNLYWQLDSLNNFIPEGYYSQKSMAGISQSGSVIRKMGSYIAHISYNYKNKYYVSAIANLSQIKEGQFINYYTLFPSVSLSWDIATELALPDNNWINELNLYSNYGTSGNYPLNGFANDTYQTLNSSTYHHFDESLLIIKQFSNHNLKHEFNKEFDLGLKSSFLNQRFSLNLAWYSKNVGNQIILRDIPEYYGGGKMYTNLGDIQVKGVDVSFEAVPMKLKDLSWVVSGNYSTSRQKVSLLADHQDIHFISTDLLIPYFIIKEGMSIGDIYGYRYSGKWTAQDELENDNNYINVQGYKFQNTDHSNSVLDANDKAVIGNSIPRFNWNLLSSIKYREFSFDFSIYSVWGMQKYNATRAATFMTGVNPEVNVMYADSSALIKTFEFYQSSLFIENASFIRLKSVSFKYEPTKKVFGLKYRFTLSIENLLTYTKYKGYDPEASIYTDNNFSDNAIDRGAYPNPKSFFATIHLTF